MPLQKIDYGQAVLLGTGEISAVDRVAHHVAMLVLAIDPGAGVIHVLPITTGQTGLIDGILLLMPRLFVLDEQVGDLTRRDRNAYIVQKFADFGFGHARSVVESYDQEAHARANFTRISRRHGGKIGALLGGRVVLLLAEENISGRQANVLHHRLFIALELGVSRQGALVYT